MGARALGTRSGEQWQFDLAIQTLQTLRDRRNEAGGDGLRLTWFVEAQDVLETTRCSWASARRAHPVHKLIYESVVHAARGKAMTTPVPHLAGALERAVAELNTVLEAPYRLQLSKLDGLQLLQLMTIAPAASESALVIPTGPAVARPPEAQRNSPWELVRWALDRPRHGGTPVSLAELAPDEAAYERALGAAAFRRILSLVAERDMTCAIDAQRLPCAGRAAESGPRSARRHHRLV